MSKRPLSLACAAATLALGVAGCGSSATKAPDPASVVPESAPVYATADVRPTGAMKGYAEADGQALAHEAKPFAGLLETLSLGGPSSAVTPAEVKPWLGEDAGLFLTHIVLPAVQPPNTLSGLLEYALSGRLLETVKPVLSSTGTGASKLYDQSQGAVVADCTDVPAAQAFLKAEAARAGARTATYKGVSYWLVPAGRAAALVDSFVVVGSQQALLEVIDTAHGGATVEQAQGYASLSSNAAPGALAHAYIDSPRLAAALARQSGAAGGASGRAGAAQLGRLMRTLDPSPRTDLYLSLTAGVHQVRLDIDSSSGGTTQPPTASGSEQAGTAAQLFEGLPEGSTVSVGTQDFGDSAAQAVSLLPALSGSRTGAGGALSSLLGGGNLGALAPTVVPSLERIIGVLSARRGKLKHGALGTLGPGALFISGTSLPEFDAGLVIVPDSPTTATAEIARMRALLAGSGVQVSPTTLPDTEAAVSVTVPGLPLPVVVAAAQGKLVVALGLSAFQDALAPSATLGGSPAYQTAVAALGEGMRPRLLVNFPALLALTRALGLSGSPTITKLTRYLQGLGTLTVGSKSLGAITRTRVLLTLPPTPVPAGPGP